MNLQFNQMVLKQLLAERELALTDGDAGTFNIIEDEIAMVRQRIYEAEDKELNSNK